MEPRKTKMLLHEDVMYQILQWLPVISLLRFKLVCKTWRALIESNDFVKHHLHHHHYDPNLKDKNHSLIQRVPGKDPTFTQLVSIDNLEGPNACVQLDCSELHGYFLLMVFDIVSYNGIVCLSFLNRDIEHRICLWNPATKQSRLLPHAPFPDNVPLSIGFGFDVKSNDYKVVKLIERGIFAGKGIFEVYSLNTSSWKRLTTVFRFSNLFANPRMPFNKGTCFFWGNSSKNKGILCFDFSSEMFRSISLPCTDWKSLHTSVVHDEIACVLRMNDHPSEIWMFNEYGTVNESWTKLYTIDTYFQFRQMPIQEVSMNGKFIFFITIDQMCIFNVVTKETNYYMLKNMPCPFDETLVGFKESLVSVEEGNNAPVCINKDSGK